MIGIGVMSLVRRGQVEEYEGGEEINKMWPWRGKEKLEWPDQGRNRVTEREAREEHI